jgi:Uma2 family endonuclease
VLSPSSARYDRGRKREKHLERAAEYWVVDIESRLAEVWRPGDERPLVVHDRLEWRPRAELPPLEIALADLFAELPD